MCFYEDYDWYADVETVTDGPAHTAARCYECTARIAPGAWRRRVEQQEHEECQRCEYEELDDGDEPCDEHDYGEQFQCDICQSCVKVLQAIEAVEADEGCPEYARQPAWGELRQAIHEDHDGRYKSRALELFPELEGEKILA